MLLPMAPQPSTAIFLVILEVSLFPASIIKSLAAGDAEDAEGNNNCPPKGWVYWCATNRRRDQFEFPSVEIQRATGSFDDPLWISSASSVSSVAKLLTRCAIEPRSRTPAPPSAP